MAIGGRDGVRQVLTAREPATNPKITVGVNSPGGRYPSLVAATASRRDVLRYALGATAAAVAGPAVLGVPRAAATSGTGDSVNVRDYGAVGDGVADDRAAIHAARDAAGVGGALVFPPGTYRIAMLDIATPGYKFGSGGLHANVAGQTWLLGAAELVLTGDQRDNLITISAPKVSIIGGTLDISEIPAEPYFNAAIAVWSGKVAIGAVYGAHGSGAAGAVIRDVTINHAATNGVHVMGTNSVTVTGCTIKNFFQHGIYVQTDVSEPTDIYDFLIHGNRLESDSASYAAALYIGANDQPTSAFDTPVARVRRARVTDNSCVIPRGILPGEGSFLEGGAEAGALQMANAEDCVIDGNITEGGTFGITTAFLRRVVISNNTCRGWRAYGIEVSGGLDGVAVTGNIIDADGAGGPYDQASGQQDPDGSLLQSNGGILSSGVTSCTNYTIAGNTITGFTTAARSIGIQLYNANRPSAGATFENVTISDNTITAGGGSAKFSGVGAYAPTTNLTITGNTIDGDSRILSSGIEIYEDTHDRLSITGNNFSSCSVAAFSLTKGVLTNIRFAGNRVQNCGAVIKGDFPS